MLSRLRRKVIWLGRLARVIAQTVWWWLRTGGWTPRLWLVVLIWGFAQQQWWDTVLLLMIGVNLALYLSLLESYEQMSAQHKKMRRALMEHREYYERLSPHNLLETFRRGPR